MSAISSSGQYPGWRKVDQDFGLGDCRAAFRTLRNPDHAPGAHLERFLVAEPAKRPQDGIAVDTEHGRQIACLWDPLVASRRRRPAHSLDGPATDGLAGRVAKVGDDD